MVDMEDDDYSEQPEVHLRDGSWLPEKYDTIVIKINGRIFTITADS